MLTNPVPKCNWSLANIYCGILWNMKKTTIELPFSSTIKFLPFFVFRDRSNFRNICAGLLWHFSDNVRVRTFLVLGTVWQSIGKKRFLWWDLCFLFTSILLLVHNERNFVDLWWKCSYINICVLSFCCISKQQEAQSWCWLTLKKKSNKKKSTMT
jgi:hypothetical protein